MDRCFQRHHHVKGTFKCIQISMGLINFLLLILGCVITGLASWYFMQFNDVLTAMPDIQNGEYVTTSKAMTPFYSILVLGVFMTFVAFSGCFGAIYLDRCCLVGYIIMLSLLLIGIIVAIVASIYLQDDFHQALDSLFSTYEQNMYGLSGSKKVVMYPLDRFIEKMHRSHTCCGFFTPIDNITAAQMAVLYWSENTHWGQVSALEYKFDLDAKFDWIHRSCCKYKGNCELNTLEHSDRLDWNDTLESFWNNQINTDSCKGRAMDFGSVAAEHKWTYYTFIAFIIILILVVYSMAITLCIVTGRAKTKQNPVEPGLKTDDLEVNKLGSEPQMGSGLSASGNAHPQYNNQPFNEAMHSPQPPLHPGYPPHGYQDHHGDAFGPPVDYNGQPLMSQDSETGTESNSQSEGMSMSQSDRVSESETDSKKESRRHHNRTKMY